MMIAPGSSRRISSGLAVGIRNSGSPRGIGPSTEMCATWARSNQPDATVASATAIRMPGHFGRQALSSRMSASEPAPISSATPLVRPSAMPWNSLTVLSGRSTALTENPNSLGI